jgi:serine/threonine protein kinase
MNRTSVADWQQLSALYGRATALDTDSLDVWLLRLEADAHPLLPQLQQMLDERALALCDELSEQGPPPHPAPRDVFCEVARREGSRFGPYRLQRLMAEGDAEVWLAQRDDAAACRPEVIRLLSRPAGQREREAFARRFERERDLLAALSHPHIAGLREAGVTASGRRWLACDFVEGVPLTAWCDRHRLGVRARVRLFTQVVLAVRHAHAHLVLHRDLKPANILVTPQGSVRVIDFGLMQLMEPDGVGSVETELTRLAGTPPLNWYSAPEQLMGLPLTTACDVYALGVVLYELLCGHRPDELIVESAAVLEQSILDTRPRAPSERLASDEILSRRGTTRARLRHDLAGDLDAIVLKTLAKQPAQRCVSAEALRAELDRWLAGEPVEARAAGRWARAGRFIKRQVDRLAAF